MRVKKRVKPRAHSLVVVSGWQAENESGQSAESESEQKKSQTSGTFFGGGLGMAGRK